MAKLSEQYVHHVFIHIAANVRKKSVPENNVRFLYTLLGNIGERVCVLQEYHLFVYYKLQIAPSRLQESKQQVSSIRFDYQCRRRKFVSLCQIISFVRADHSSSLFLFFCHQRTKLSCPSLRSSTFSLSSLSLPLRLLSLSLFLSRSHSASSSSRRKAKATLFSSSFFFLSLPYSPSEALSFLASQSTQRLDLASSTIFLKLTRQLDEALAIGTLTRIGSKRRIPKEQTSRKFVERVC